MSPLVAFAIFLAVTGLVVGVGLLLRVSEDRLEQRLAELTGKVSSPAVANPLKESTVLAQPLDSTKGLVETFLARFLRLTRWFQQADTSITPSQFFAICSGVTLFGIAGSVAAGMNPAVALVVGLFTGSLPIQWLMFRRRRRFQKFEKQLPDALELISRALRAGHSLASGFNFVAEQMPAPIRTEFRKAFEEQNLGIPLDEALEGMTERMPNLDLDFFATAVILQRTTGGDLAEILDKIGRLIRERFQIRGQVQALTGDGRFSGIVLLALPPVLFVALWQLNPDYAMLLFTDPMGKMMLAGAIVMQILGALVIRKIVNIRV
ncbi:MAG TPA: type II secretion system F family protein [Pirellulales bacterium]|jgi:tight adherence protein B|nr:type II secretion system F family protein [Pirellulales bacterium]